MKKPANLETYSEAFSSISYIHDNQTVKVRDQTLQTQAILHLSRFLPFIITTLYFFSLTKGALRTMRDI